MAAELLLLHAPPPGINPQSLPSSAPRALQFPSGPLPVGGSPLSSPPSGLSSLPLAPALAPSPSRNLPTPLEGCRWALGWPLAVSASQRPAQALRIPDAPLRCVVCVCESLSGDSHFSNHLLSAFSPETEALQICGLFVFFGPASQALGLESPPDRHWAILFAGGSG